MRREIGVILANGSHPPAISAPNPMEQPFETGSVRGTLHTPDQATGDGLAITHGAGSNAESPLLAAIARACCGAGFLVFRYDLPYRVARPHGPPSAATSPRDREGVKEAIAALRPLTRGRLFAGGHSYGGRQTAMVAAEHPGLADRLLLLGYPLHPPRKPEVMRTAFFPAWHTPALFVHGTRDPFGTIAELQAALIAIPAQTELFPVEGAGHELKARGILVPGLAEAILTRMLF